MKTASLSHLKIEIQYLFKKHYDIFFNTIYKKIKSIFFKKYTISFF